MAREAFVTLVVGARYRRLYDRHVRDTHERLARRTGRPLVVLDEDALPPSRVDHPHPSWRKLRIFEAERTRAFDRLCWLDADVVAMDGAPDPLEVPGAGWLAVDNDAFGDPVQAAADREWHWTCPPERAPRRLINTGVMVLEREPHAPLLRAVHDAWTGRWDQGPLSFHLQACAGRFGSPDLNRVVVHHLAAHGFGRRGLRSLVERPGLVHFAADAWAPASYLAYVAAADAGDRAARRALERRAERTAPWGALWYRVRRHLRHHPEGPAAAARRRRDRWALARALRRCPRLLLSPHATTAVGAVAVDVSAAMDAADACLSERAALTVARDLEEVVTENVLERLPDPQRVPHLERCARALRPGGRLQVAVATGMADGPRAFREAMRRAYTLSEETLAELGGVAGLRGARVRRGGELRVGGSRRRLPPSYAVLSWP